MKMEMTKEMIQHVRDLHRGFQGVQSKDDAQVQAICDLAIAGLDRTAIPVEANREALLVEVLNELRSCSRAKIGKDDDFACADKQMRDALAAYSEEKP